MEIRHAGPVGCTVLVSWVVLFGCTADATSDRSSNAMQPAGHMSGAFGNSGGTVMQGTAGCRQRNLTQACTCDGKPGRQVCDGSVWSSCECGSAGALPSFAGNQRSDITFDWTVTPAIDEEPGECLPGQYEGNFNGWYWSIIAGVATTSTLGTDGLAVPIVNIDIPGEVSGFHFTVEPAEGGEVTQRVSGVMEGNADGVFPFTAKIEGALNCRTSTFDADMQMGLYSVLVDGLVAQTFTGVMQAHFDKRTQTFVDGVWDVWETSATPPGMRAKTWQRDYTTDGYGGSGEWAAGRATDLSDPNLKPCPSGYTCEGNVLGPNKLLCNDASGVATLCGVDADCDQVFPGEGVSCLKASAFSLCLRECKP